MQPRKVVRTIKQVLELAKALNLPMVLEQTSIITDAKVLVLYVYKCGEYKNGNVRYIKIKHLCHENNEHSIYRLDSFQKRLAAGLTKCRACNVHKQGETLRAHALERRANKGGITDEENQIAKQHYIVIRHMKPNKRRYVDWV